MDFHVIQHIVAHCTRAIGPKCLATEVPRALPINPCLYKASWLQSFLYSSLKRQDTEMPLRGLLSSSTRRRDG
jgi:hypothetical protein